MTGGTAREHLAAVLGPLLGDDVEIIPDPRSIASLNPGKRYTVQIVRANFRQHPVSPQASYLEQLHVWVVTHQGAQPAAEDDLDEIVLEVTAALQKITRADPWETADRMKHPDGHHAYRIAVTYTTDKE